MSIAAKQSRIVQSEGLWVGGVPAMVFDCDDWSGTVVGRSGTGLDVELRSDYIHIFEEGDAEDDAAACHFQAEVQGGVFQFSVRTQDKYGFTHPDLYAARLVRQGFGYLAARQTIDTVEAQWHQGGTNYDQYHYALEVVSAVQDRDIAKAFAARCTWTAEQVRALGFGVRTGDVHEVRTVDGDPMIKALFHKEIPV